MKSFSCFVAILVLICLPLALTAGCGSKEEVIIPNKPPLSKEEALKRAERIQQGRIKSMQEQAKKQAKKQAQKKQ